MSIRAALAEQTAKTKGLTNTDIRRLIADSELRLASLESKIAESESAAAAPMEGDSTLKFVEGEPEAPLASSFLLEQRDHERITAAVLRHLVAPIRSLPVELLAEIFSLTIRDKELLYSIHSRHFQDAYRVSHICSEWRQIAHCTPQLWTGSVTVTVGYPVTQDVEDPDVEDSVTEDVEDALVQGARWTVSGTGPDSDGLMIRAWLAHSGPLPVPIVLMGLHGLPESILAGRKALHLRPVLEELLRVAPRWGILHLYGFLPPMFYLRLADRTLDSLEEARLGEFNVDYPALFLLGTSPRLRKLTVTGNPPLHMPWAQLTELTLTYYPSTSVCLNTLVQCTNLITLTLSGTDRQNDVGTNVTLPSLRVLNFAFRRNSNARLPTLNFLFAPILETCSISFRFRAHSRSWKQAVFTTFLLRSPNITYLRLDSCPLTSHELIAALVHTPCLSHLELNKCHHIDDAFLLALSYKHDSGTPPLVPLLHEFRLLDTPKSLTASLVVGMLASRWRTHDELASSSPIIPLPVARWSLVLLDQQLEDTMKELQRQGLPVYGYSIGR
ncbi:hypothetical protein B0H16DRAFT_1697721 [Mycena metata]|uniref:F-box domain-containing protein n=1 Tax=Mycena metata TaxID=1033252 RepID=A0AAD7HSL4_9AGAR|nr:hypothetical protein B0H16DRAFT_1697721 [Mycena metata]